MPAPQRVDRQTFLTHLRQSGLLSSAELAVAEKHLPASNRGRVLARALVEKGLLTKFQAERLLIGRTAGFLLGQYRILGELGRGGMGRVFKAEHRTMNRIVALKVLAPEVLRTDRAQELFLREVRAAAQLVHPNIVTAYDANIEDQRYYLVLEYIDGPNLDQLVRRQGPQPVGRACDYVRQIALGLQCAHLRGMVHRDIKPANILVQRRGLNGDDVGLVKISDFGLARLQAPEVGDSNHPGTILTRGNTVMGTPDFLSPEQARSLHKTDIRSDLYSLGCTFFYLLTGQVLFPGGSSLDKLIRHSTDAPPSLAKLRPDTPPEVVAIVERLLAKHPLDRFQTPAELAQALEPYAVSGPTPWAPLPQAAEILDDGPDTPVGAISDDSAERAAALVEDDLSAMVNTLSHDTSPTPVAPPSGRVRAHTRRPKSLWPLWLTLFCALAFLFVVGLAGGLAILLHLLGRL